MKKVFDFDDYKDFLLHAIEHHGSASWGYRTKIAEVLGCGKSFVSQVLNGHVHLSHDHALALCQHWRFDKDETQYFLDLVSFARAGTPALRKFLQTKLEEARRHQQEPSERFRWATVTGEIENLYYSSWLYGAMHVASDVPEFQTVAGMARRFRIDESEAALLTRTLCEMGLIADQGGKFSPRNVRLHLAKGSPVLQSHHTNWRLKALESSRNPLNDGLHYASVFAMERRLFEELRRRLLDSVAAMNEDIARSASEDVFAFSLDLFRV